MLSSFWRDEGCFKALRKGLSDSFEVFHSLQKRPSDFPDAICCGLQRYIQDHRPDIYVFSSLFAGFRKVLDREMKRLRSSGLGVSVKQAEPITVHEENQLWEKGVLGDHSLQSLVDIMLFLCGLNFAQRCTLSKW